MKKLIGLLLSVIILSSVFTGCGKDSSNNSSSTGGTTLANTTKAASSVVNEYGWTVPEKTLEFSYFYTRAEVNPDKDAENMKLMDQYLLEKFNVKIERRVIDAKPKERLNIMLAAEDYPDVIVGLDEVAFPKWKSQNKVIDLTAYMDKTGQNIIKALGDSYKKYLDADGKWWYIPNGYGKDTYPWFCASYRYDLYMEMGSPSIETPEDYYNFLKQLVEKYPETANGEKTYALSWLENNTNRLDVIAGIWGIKDGYKVDAGNNLVHWLNTSEGLEMTKYFNMYSRNGLLDPDAFINKEEDWKTKFSNERVFGHIGQWFEILGAGHEVWMQTNKDWKEDMRFIPVKIKAASADGAYLAPKDTTGWEELTCITDKCKNPGDVVRFIDFTTTGMGERLVSFGVPNLPDSVWNYEGNNKWSYNQTQKQLIIDGKFDSTKYQLMGSEAHFFAIPMSPFGDDNKTLCWINQNFVDEDKWKKMMNDNLKDTIFDNTARRIVFETDNPLTIVKQRVEDSIKTGWAKAVMSKTEEECIKNFNDLKDKCNDVGLHDIEKFRTDAYKKNLELWK